MKNTLLLFFSIIIYSAQADPACNCKLFVEPEQEYLDGKNMGIVPGDTICIKAGTKRYLQFKNFSGDSLNPLVFINYGGEVIIHNEDHYYGFTFNNCSYFKLSGRGDKKSQYGIRVTKTGKDATGLSFDGYSSDFEVENVEIAHTGFAGLIIKTNGAIGWEMKNVSVHHLYIHDTGGEGMYIGETSTPSHSIVNIEVYNNIVCRTGWDLFQIANATENVKVYNNIFYKGGLQNKNEQNNGMQIGDNTVGDYYNNIVKDVSGNALMVFGSGEISIYNNFLSKAEGLGIFIDSRTVSLVGSKILIYDNYLKETGLEFIRNMNTVNQIEISRNVFGKGKKMISGEGFNVKLKDNKSEDFPDLIFQDPENDNFKIKENNLFEGIGIKD